VTTVLVWFVIERDGAVLLGRRKAGQPPFESTWTLPGDVMGEEESTSETIERFANDQLDVRVIGDDFIDTLELTDSGTEYTVNVFRALYMGEPRFRESGPFDDVVWATAAEIEGDSMAMPAALRTLLLHLLTEDEA
jgi:ADP-ribose pyrophosphatase YjhB (NUDIX family)